MPELPEVEVVRSDLAPAITGRRIRAADATNARITRRHARPGDLARALTGRTIVDVGRRGKYLVLALDDDAAFVVHLGMSGQLLLARRRRDPRPRHTHAVLDLAGAGELRYVDPRTFGELFVVAAGQPVLPDLGLDAFGIGRRDFAARIGTRRAQLKALLMDQRVVAGLGNIYSDEALFTARLRGDRLGSSLTGRELTRLHAAVTTILATAVAERGSSLPDGQYVDTLGRLGRYQLLHQVYGREDEPCPRCGRPVVRRRWSGRSTFSCPRCQR